MNAPSLAFFASIAVLFAIWRTLGALLWKMASVFIGEVVIIGVRRWDVACTEADLFAD